MNLISHFKSQKEKKLITFLNPYSYLIARKDINLFSNFTIKIDGGLLVKTLKIFGFKNVIRESFDMTSLAPIVFSNSIEKSSSIYLIGTKPNTIDIAIRNIKEIYPSLNIVGYKHGYIKNEIEKKEILQDICKVNPDIVICGMGTPLQESFLLDLQNIGWQGTGYTCGGFLHQTAENIKYYPEWIDKYNLRWAYRIYDEPKLFKRYFVYYPLFFIYFTKDYLNYKNFNKN